MAPLTLSSDEETQDDGDAYARHDQLNEGVCGEVDDPGDSP